MFESAPTMFHSCSRTMYRPIFHQVAHRSIRYLLRWQVPPAPLRSCKYGAFPSVRESNHSKPPYLILSFKAFLSQAMKPSISFVRFRLAYISIIRESTCFQPKNVCCFYRYLNRKCVIVAHKIVFSFSHLNSMQAHSLKYNLAQKEDVNLKKRIIFYLNICAR